MNFLYLVFSTFFHSICMLISLTTNSFNSFCYAPIAYSIPMYSSLSSSPLHFSSLLFTSLHFSSLHFSSLLFTSLHFSSLLFTLLLFSSLYFSSLLFTSLHFSSLLFTSLHFSSLFFFFLFIRLVSIMFLFRNRQGMQNLKFYSSTLLMYCTSMTSEIISCRITIVMKGEEKMMICSMIRYDKMTR